MTDRSLSEERERIGRQLEQGCMTATEHKRLSGAIDRAEDRDRQMLQRAEARRRYRRDHQARRRAKLALRRVLTASLEQAAP